MKTRYLIYSIALIGLMTACKSDPKWSPQVLTYSETIVVGWTSANVILLPDSQSAELVKGLEIQYSTSADLHDALLLTATPREDGYWQCDLTNLKDSCEYSISYRFTPDYLQPAEHTSSFSTTPFPAPDVKTKEATAITATTATLSGSATTIAGNDPITECGFYYSLLREGEIGREQVVCGSGEGDFSADISALRANATYYYVAYAVNCHGIAYGDTLQFNTLNPYE